VNVANYLINLPSQSQPGVRHRQARISIFSTSRL
jgi:hypothetical protein